MNYEKQKQYLSEILAPIKEMWMSEKIEQWVVILFFLFAVQAFSQT